MLSAKLDGSDESMVATPRQTLVADIERDIAALQKTVASPVVAVRAQKAEQGGLFSALCKCFAPSPEELLRQEKEKAASLVSASKAEINDLQSDIRAIRLKHAEEVDRLK